MLVLLTAIFGLAASPARYLRVRVSNPEAHELVHANVPLMLAQNVAQAINRGQLRALRCVRDVQAPSSRCKIGEFLRFP